MRTRGQSRLSKHEVAKHCVPPLNHTETESRSLSCSSCPERPVPQETKAVPSGQHEENDDTPILSALRQSCPSGSGFKSVVPGGSDQRTTYGTSVDPADLQRVYEHMLTLQKKVRQLLCEVVSQSRSLDDKHTEFVAAVRSLRAYQRMFSVARERRIRREHQSRKFCLEAES